MSLAIVILSLEIMMLPAIFLLQGMVLAVKSPLHVCTAFLGKHVVMADQLREELHLEIGHALYDQVDYVMHHQVK